jgi:hypothetical protein
MVEFLLKLALVLFYFCQNSIDMKTLLTLLLSALVLTCDAQSVVDPMINTEVKDSIGPEESVPLMSNTSDGGTYVSYFALYNGSYQMRLQLLDSAGNRLFGQMGLLVSNQPQSTAIFRYDLKTDANDNAVIAFQDIRTGGNLHVVVYKIDKQGNFLWGNNGVQLIDPISDEGLAPTIGFTNAQNVIISWNASSSASSWVAVSKLDPAGVTLWPNTLRVIDSTFSKRYTRPTTVPAGADDFSMLYVEQTGFGLGVSNMYANRYDANGIPVWSTPVHVSTKTISFFYFCEAVSDGLDGFFVGFTTSDNNFPAISDVYAQHVDGNGNLWNATGNIACNLANTQRFCNATRFQPGNGFYTLIKTTDVNQNQSGVLIQAFDITGNLLLTPPGVQLIPTQAAYADPFDFAFTSDGIIIGYTEGALQNKVIKAIKCDFVGAFLWLGFPAYMCTQNTPKDDLSCGLFLNNQVVFVWMDGRNDYGIYAQNVSNEGLLGPLSGIAQNDFSENSLQLIPNPATHQSTLTTIAESPLNALVTISDISGKTITTMIWNTEVTKQLELPIAELNQGVYLIEVVTKSTSKTLKLVKQ